jgi:uncharacterized protein with HEPN domain
MPPDVRDPKYLWDMLDAARTIVQMTAGVSYEQYSKVAHDAAGRGARC